MKIKLALFYFIFGCSSLFAQLFEDETAALGIDHINYDPNLMGGGVAVLDFNNDGWEDLYFVGGQYSDHLYLNIDGERFEDISVPTGLDAIADRYTSGVVTGDIDGDGYTDIIVTTWQDDHTILLKNINGVSVEDRSAEAGLLAKSWSTMATLADTDLDGDLDLYVGNYLTFDGDPFFQNILEPLPNFYYTNNGDGTFVLSPMNIIGGVNGCTLVSSFTDVDFDGDPDLFVLNDFGQRFTPNELYINENGIFTENSEAYGTRSAINSMGIAVGDTEELGEMNYYISNIGTNIFYVPNSDSTFIDLAVEKNIDDGGGISWGTFFTDINNDSYLDLYVAKGTLSEADFPLNNRLYLFQSNTNKYIEVALELSLADPNKGRGAVFADLDNDGIQDIILNNIKILESNSGESKVYYGDKLITNNYFKIKLQGTSSNTNAYGARLELHADQRKFIREIHGGSSYLSNNSSVAHFGLSNIEVIDSLVIHWPGKSANTLYNLNVNTYYNLKQGEEPSIIISHLNTSRNNITPSNDDLIIELSPNPSKNYLNWTISRNTQFNISSIVIYDTNGRPVKQLEDDSFSTNSGRISISQLPSGIYHFTIAGQFPPITKTFTVLK
ncbi:MAG: T9SS type A sorting domain-containing protein [Saprospiraceae bacterium]|nr:T9SS type A sorting domain-containing protein [Saprospiraceae bacterium]